MPESPGEPPEPTNAKAEGEVLPASLEGTLPDRGHALEAAGQDPPDPLVGRVISDRYRILERIATGGMSAVYRGEHIHMLKRVAVKVLDPKAERLPELVQRFQREAIAGAHVRHPNIASATDFGQLEDGSYFLVLEFVAGTSLNKIIANGPLPVERAVRIARQIAAALHSAHEMSIVHRDVKPANVMLVDGQNDQVKLIDFGLAQVRIDQVPTVPPAAGRNSRDEAPLTGVGIVFGTVAYMAPEASLGMAAVDARSDLYALGIVLYELIAGQHPFDGREPVQLFLQHRTSIPPPISVRTPGVVVPPSVEDVVRRLLQKDPKARYQTAREVITALDDAMLHAASGQSPELPSRGDRNTSTVSAAGAEALAAVLAESSGDLSEKLSERPVAGGTVASPAVERYLAASPPPNAPSPGLAAKAPSRPALPSFADEPSAAPFHPPPLAVPLPPPPSARPVPEAQPTSTGETGVASADRPKAGLGREILDSDALPTIAIGTAASALTEAPTVVAEALSPKGEAGKIPNGATLRPEQLPLFERLWDWLSERAAIARDRISRSESMRRLHAGLGVHPSLRIWGLVGVGAAVLILLAAAIARRRHPPTMVAQSLPIAIPSASAISAPPTPVESASVGPALGELEAGAHRVALRGAFRSKDWAKGTGAVLALLKLEPSALRDRELQAAMLGCSVGLAQTEGEATDKFFEALTNDTGTAGLDTLYEIGRWRAGSKASKRAREILRRPEVVDRATPELKVLLDLQAASCTGKRGLFGRVADEGDARAMTELVILRDTQCSRWRDPCCFQENRELTRAITALRSRIAAHDKGKGN